MRGEDMGSSSVQAEARPAAGLQDSSPLESLHPAIVNLRDHWGQLDEDGISIAVSRQAVEETLALFSEVLAAAIAVAPIDKMHGAICSVRGDAYDELRRVIAKATAQPFSSKEPSSSPSAVSASALSTDDHND